MIWAIIGLVIAAIIILLSTLHVYIDYHYQNRVERMEVRIYLYRIRIVQKTFDDAAFGKFFHGRRDHSFMRHVHRIRRTISDRLSMIRDSSHAVRSLLLKIRITFFQWHTLCGTPSAGRTAIACGGVWTVKGLMQALLRHQCKLDCQPSMEVTPLYGGTAWLHSEMAVAFSIPVAGALHTMFKLRKSRQAPNND